MGRGIDGIMVQIVVQILVHFHLNSTTETNCPSGESCELAIGASVCSVGLLSQFAKSAG
jgi:hypothetical protein